MPCSSLRLCCGTMRLGACCSRPPPGQRPIQFFSHETYRHPGFHRFDRSQHAEAGRQSKPLLPIDSEHNAVHQCLRGGRMEEVERIWLTASGGPFLYTPKSQFSAITVEQAMNHPTWKMGQRVTIDSATLMNKGFEVIEACRLFNLPPRRVRVLVHPQSTIHSMVEFVDGSILAQFSVTDMRLPILYALT